MSMIKNFFNSLAVRNAVQQRENGSNSTTFINRSIDPYELLYGHSNKAGKYDNLYENSNRIVTAAAKYPFYYTVDDEVIEPDESTFSYYLKSLNDSYPQRKVLEQLYTELITHGYTDIFIWRKDGRGETSHFEKDKTYKEDDFRGITLVSGYDQGRLSNKDKDNIVRITYGASQANVFMGYSPTQAAQSWRKMQDEMGLHMTAFARNAGMPIGQWVITASSPEEYVKIRKKLEEKTAGAKNNGKQLYSYQPSDAKQAQIHWVQYTSQDVQDYTPSMEFADKKMSKDFGVPGTVKGTNDGENYATANVSKQGFVEWTIEPLVSTLKEQLEFYIAKRFDIRGVIKVDVEIPELADESLVKIRATTAEVALFDKKISEGYTPESIVRAFALPDRFLLLEKADDTTENNQNKVKKKLKHSIQKKNVLLRHYQNALTTEDRNKLEQGFTEILTDYAKLILAGSVSIADREDFEGKMTANFKSEYAYLYAKSTDDVADALADLLEVVDVASLELTEDELEYAATQYNERVKAFSQSYTDEIAKIEGATLAVRSKAAEPHIKMVAVTESEHSRIVSELKAWTKGEEEFPVRVYKTWHAQPDACPECLELDDVQIDVTALFVDNPTNEIYEVQGGGLHPNCRCFVRYEMEKE